MTNAALRTAMLFRTEHANATAITAAIPGGFSRRLGGVRFVESGSVDEVVHLASGMDDKCAASRVPVGGHKALVICPGGVPTKSSARASLLAAHIREVLPLSAAGIYGPDMNCGADVLDQLAPNPAFADHVTGLSPAAFGVDINQRAFTANGVARAIDAFQESNRLRGNRVSIQGFGMVGAPLAATLAARGFAIQAVSNASGTLFSADGLDIGDLIALWRERGDECLSLFRAPSTSRRAAPTYVTDPGALLAVPTDVFVPAARTTVLALADELADARRENPDVVAIERFLEQTGCSLIAQAANHPMSTAAEEYAHARGVGILPDVLVNTGGMVGCYAEWRYRDRLRNQQLSFEELSERCEEHTAKTVRENVIALGTMIGPVRAATRLIVDANRRAMSGLDSTSDLFELDVA